MLIGYARVSTRDQKPHLQQDALREAGCERIFEETASGARRERPELTAALDFMRSGAIAWWSGSSTVWRALSANCWRRRCGCAGRAMPGTRQ